MSRRVRSGPERQWRAAIEIRADDRAFRPEMVAKECGHLRCGMFLRMGLSWRRWERCKDHSATSHGFSRDADVYPSTPRGEQPARGTARYAITADAISRFDAIACP